MLLLSRTSVLCRPLFEKLHNGILKLTNEKLGHDETNVIALISPVKSYPGMREPVTSSAQADPGTDELACLGVGGPSPGS